MIGQYIQNYQVLSHLGEGGMGVVYKAADNVLGREVALKMLHGAMIRQPQVLERFKKEAQVLARLLHPNIAVIYNFIEQEGQYFMVMEYVEGKNLDALARTNTALPHHLVVSVFIQALEGLQHAHKKGIFHRDIKPSNLILTPEGTVKLMDFGIAKIAGEQKLTQVNRVIGTVEFMAPEIIAGKDASVSSDIYATGITMYELLSGRLPFESGSDYNLMQDIMKKKPAPLKTINPAVTAVLSDIIMKALEKKPEQRFASAKQMQQALLAAFPACRDADLSVLSPVAQTLYETREQSISFSPATIVQAPPTALHNFEKKVLLNKKTPYILAGAGVLFFLVLFLFIRFSNRPVADKLANHLLADTLKQAVQVHDQGNLLQEPVQTGSVSTIPVRTVMQEEEKNTGTKDLIAKKTADKKANKKEITKKQVTAQVSAVEEKKEEQPAPVKKSELREMVTTGNIRVSLSMRETITREEDDKDQSVSFTVTSPVYYQGVVIIQQGAIATGGIRIGRVISLVSINSVMAANGQQIHLNGRDHRKVKKLASDREYIAVIERGTRMRF